jgi:hypothetical protein
MPKTTANLLRLTAQAGATASASQQITGLTPQKVYNLEVAVVDPQQDGSEIVYPFAVEIDNAQVLDTMQRQVTNFSYRHKPVYNVYKIRFRANSSQARIVLKQTANANGSLLVDAVRITPAFE